MLMLFLSVLFFGFGDNNDDVDDESNDADADAADGFGQNAIGAGRDSGHTYADTMYRSSSLLLLLIIMRRMIRSLKSYR